MPLITPDMVEPVFGDPNIGWREENLQALYNTELNVPYPNDIRLPHIDSLRDFYRAIRGEDVPKGLQEFSEYLRDIGMKPLVSKDKMHGGTFMEIGRSGPTEDPLSDTIRLYFNPGIVDTIPFFRGALLHCANQLGEHPAAKFRFEGLNPKDPLDRSHKDRVVVYARSIPQARAVLDFASGFNPSDPRPTIPFAHPVIMDGNQQSWIGIGDSPNSRTSMGEERPSLTQSRIKMLLIAKKNFNFKEVMTDKQLNCTPEELAEVFSSVAIINGVHPESMAFNASRDLDDLQATLNITLAER